MAGYTLTQIRQFTAKEAGKFWTGTAASTSSTTQLIDTAWPVNSGIQASGFYKDYFLYRPNAVTATDKVRYVETYTGQGGILQPDLSYTNAPSGETYELHGMLEPLTAWTNCINEGLQHCFIPFEYSFSPSSNTATRFSLSTAVPWLYDPWLVRKAGVLSSGTSREANDPYVVGAIRGQCDNDHGTIYLNTYPRTFQTTDTIYLMVLAPAYYVCGASSSGPFTQQGLSLETDVALVDNYQWAGYAALEVAWRRFSQIMDQTVNGRLVNSWQQAVAQFNE